MDSSAYLFAQHLYTLVPAQVREDIAWMADNGVGAIAIASLEQDLDASPRNIDHLFRAARSGGIGIWLVPSRWAGLVAGAPKVPSMWACNHPEAWALRADGRPLVNPFSGIVCSLHHPAVEELYRGLLDRYLDRWPFAGVLWDEPKSLRLVDHHPLAIAALGADAPRERRLAGVAGFFGRINRALKARRDPPRTALFIYAQSDDAEVAAMASTDALDEYGCDGAPWAAGPGEDIAQTKTLLDHAPRHLAAAAARGRRSLMLIENLALDRAENARMAKRLPEVLALRPDHLLFYYYGRNLEDPEETMAIVREALRRGRL